MSADRNFAREIWATASQRICAWDRASFDQWFANMAALEVTGGVLVLGVPDNFFREWVESNFDSMLTEALRDIDGVDYRYSFRDVPAGELPVSPAVPAVSAAEPVVSSPAAVPARQYSFENFVVGAANRHAYAAALAVAGNPGGVYNPLFLYGTNGVGKTHLLQAMAGRISASRPGLNVRAVSCADMVNDFYELISSGRGGAFRNEYRDVDVLLIDDIHCLSGKERLQEDFFNLYNSFYSRGRQIVFTCDRQPLEIQKLDKRLSTRFEQGLVCQVGMPEFEERLVILRMWREQSLLRPVLSDTILEFLADRISSTVRRLLSCFHQLSLHVSLNGCSNLSVAEAGELLQAQIADEISAVTLTAEGIQQTVAEYFGIKVADIIGTCRAKRLAEPRMIAMYLCRKHLSAVSSTELGSIFGRSHANILHAEKAISGRCDAEPALRDSIAKLEVLLQQGK